MTLARQNGAAALTVGADRTADDAQMVRLFARDGEAIVMDDPYGDGWLGRPCLPIPWQPTPQWTTAHRDQAAPVAWYASTLVQCPVLTLVTETYAPPRATASVVLECATGDGWQTWEGWTAKGGDDGGWTTHTLTRPMHGVAYLTHATWRLRHHVRDGVGSITTHVIGAYQRHTNSADEVPDTATAASDENGEEAK